MATLKQKFETMFEFQKKIEAQEERLKDMQKEKHAMIRAFNAPIVQRIVDSISSFLARQLEESGEDSFDISNIDISIGTGRYEDINMCGAEAEVFEVVHELKYDESGKNVLVVYQYHCLGNDWDAYDEPITKRLSVLRSIAKYLADKYKMPLTVSTASLVFNGDSDYYQQRMDATDERCDEYGQIPIKEDD